MGHIVVLPGASRPRTPARGVSARGVLLVPFGLFFIIFKIFEKKMEKHFLKFGKKIVKSIEKVSQTCLDDAQNIPKTCLKHCQIMSKLDLILV